MGIGIEARGRATVRKADPEERPVGCAGHCLALHRLSLPRGRGSPLTTHCSALRHRRDNTALQGIARTLLWENKQLESSVRCARTQLEEALRPEAVLKAWHACALEVDTEDDGTAEAEAEARETMRYEFRGVVESVGLLHISLEKHVGAEQVS
jgi:hypothetical protein